MDNDLTIGFALEIVGNACECHARFLAGKVGRYADADMLRRAYKKVRNFVLSNVVEETLKH